MEIEKLNMGFNLPLQAMMKTIGLTQKKNSLKKGVLLIQHSKYSSMLLKIHSYRLLYFGDFAHWVKYGERT